MEAPEPLNPLEGYNAWAPWYDADGNPLIAIEGPVVHAWLSRLAGRRALDLGCGTGRHTLALVQTKAIVVAVDQSPAMLALARAKLREHDVHWVRHALPAPLPFPSEAFHAVVLGLVAEHVQDLGALLAEASRVLAPGGRLILSALHEDRTAEGMRARFIDPVTGLRRPVVTYHRTIADYLEAATRVGLGLVEERTLVVPAALAERLPRAEPYVGKPLGWAARWEKAV
jgi:SAM-dependent methyltransferase